MHIIDPKFKDNLAAYMAQSALATVTLMVVFSIEDTIAHAAIFAAMGSTTFVVFAMPRSVAATPRRVVGGHLVGVVVGGSLALFLESSLGMSLQGQAAYVFDLFAALSVGLATLIMVITNTEHAPAAGTALGLVLIGWRVDTVVFVLTATAALSLIHQVLGNRLKDLV